MEKMATPIAPTPVFEGKAAKKLEEYMNRPMTEEEIKVQERIRKTRDVPMFNLD
ncbi:MAG: hypothetical protein K6A34_04130 [Methanobrevibacter sp.]|nr:hypothetical protein [Methanobrevibacter sp.]